MSTHNMFLWRTDENYPSISSNTHLICSTGNLSPSKCFIYSSAKWVSTWTSYSDITSWVLEFTVHLGSFLSFIYRITEIHTSQLPNTSQHLNKSLVHSYQQSLFHFEYSRLEMHRENKVPWRAVLCLPWQGLMSKVKVIDITSVLVSGSKEYVYQIWTLHLDFWVTSWKNLFLPYANNKGADQPAHPCSLISTFVVRCLDSRKLILAISKMSKLYLVCVDE